MKSILLIFILLLHGLVNSQTNLENIRFKHLTTENGLPQNTVLAILQDKNGFMWFGTGGGLVRYDGYTMRVYSHNPNDSTSISDNRVFCMVEDNEGEIWCGNRRSGISVLNPKTGKFRRYNYIKDDSTSLNYPDVRSICKDKNGDIWIATGTGINMYDKKSDQFVQYNYNQHSNCPVNNFSIFSDSKGLVWICSLDNGLSSFDKHKHKFTNYTPDGNNPKAISTHIITGINEDKDNLLWVISRWGPGINIFDRTTQSFTYKFQTETNLQHDHFIAGITCDRNNNMWIGNYVDGLTLYDSEKKQFMRYVHDANDKYSLLSNAVRCIYEDKSGIIWIGTELGGIDIYDPKQSVFTVYRHIDGDSASLSGNSIYSVCEDKNGYFWISIKDIGIDAANFLSGKIKRFKPLGNSEKSLSSNIITSVSIDDSGQIWATHEAAGVSVFDKSLNNFKSISIPEMQTFVNYSMVDSKGKLWFGVNHPGLNVYDPKTNKYLEGYDYNPKDSANTLGLRYISTIYEDKDGNIWAGSGNSGLTFFDRKTFKFKLYIKSKDKNSISHNVVNSIMQSSNGIIWIGTAMGLNAFNKKNNTFKHYFSGDGLPSDEILSILEDKEKNLWLATSKGLCKFNPEKNTFFNYDLTDGLPGLSFSFASCKGKDGKFYLGTLNGLVSFNPEQIKKNNHKPTIILTDFTVQNKPWNLPQHITYTKEITLSYREYFFALELAALDFSAPEKNQYAYKLEGFNKDWVYLGNKREITFTNLDAGTYYLKAKGSNNHGVWCDETTLLKITITPPWWKTKTFYGICFTLIILIIYIYIKWREMKLQAEKQKLKDKIDIATVEIRKQKQLIEEKNKDITDSINYGLRIQQAYLPEKTEILASFPNSFILFKPKDIVSGDFYFYQKKESLVFIAAADCTGHGVPGAFMSMVGSERLTDAVQESNEPGEILSILNRGVKNSLHQFDVDKATRDGMDIALCSVDVNSKEIVFSGANRPIWIIRNGQKDIEEIKATKKAIGGITPNNQIFDSHKFILNKGDSIYIFSDGYADLFTNTGKKLTTKKLKEILLDIQHKSMHDQEKFLMNYADNWRAESEQIDDILIIGIRF